MIVSSYRIVERWGNDKVYCRIVFAIYSATYCCGVPMTHLAGSSEVSFKNQCDEWYDDTCVDVYEERTSASPPELLTINE